MASRTVTVIRRMSSVMSRTSTPQGVNQVLARDNARLARKVAQLERDVALARHTANHDPLTGLPNRTLLLDRLRQAVLSAERQQSDVGVLLLDLDGFKQVNDELGHAAGDQLLCQVAARLAASVRACDTASRYGGDEFVILLPGVRGAEDVQAMALKVAAELKGSFVLNGEFVDIGASIGTATFAADTKVDVDLIGAADRAMYRAKPRAVAARSNGAG
jgi:diguanylate cyclase (GGDEF)-like protein